MYYYLLSIQTTKYCNKSMIIKHISHIKNQINKVCTYNINGD